MFFEYLPTFGWFWGQMFIHIPAPWFAYGILSHHMFHEASWIFNTWAYGILSHHMFIYVPWKSMFRHPNKQGFESFVMFLLSHLVISWNRMKGASQWWWPSFFWWRWKHGQYLIVHKKKKQTSYKMLQCCWFTILLVIACYCLCFPINIATK